jgi:hypothetical protein
MCVSAVIKCQRENGDNWQPHNAPEPPPLQLSLCLIKRHDMKAHGGMEVHLHYRELGIGGGEWSVSRPLWTGLV